jgi:hypothetical protein
MYHFGASVFDYCNGHSVQQVFIVPRLWMPPVGQAMSLCWQRGLSFY